MLPPIWICCVAFYPISNRLTYHQSTKSPRTRYWIMLCSPQLNVSLPPVIRIVMIIGVPTGVANVRERSGRLATVELHQVAGAVGPRRYWVLTRMSRSTSRKWIPTFIVMKDTAFQTLIYLFNSYTMRADPMPLNVLNAIIIFVVHVHRRLKVEIEMDCWFFFQHEQWTSYSSKLNNIQMIGRK